MVAGEQQPVVCIVCGKSEPWVQNRCANCQVRLHQECGTQEQLAGNYVSCPRCTEIVQEMQWTLDHHRARLQGLL